MARHGFGKGEYKYSSYPLPQLVTELRTSIYPKLVPVAQKGSAATSSIPFAKAALAQSHPKPKGQTMKPEMIRVEPYSTWLESWKAPTSAVSRANGFVFVSGMPPYDPETGQVIENATIEKQTELVLEQMKKCLEAAGSDLDHVVKVIVYSARADKFAEINGPGSRGSGRVRGFFT